MFIYRVEDDGGHGMYTGVCTVGGQMFELTGRHPTPNCDAGMKDEWNALLFYRGSYIFGFSTLEQFKAWVYKSEWREALRDEGFYLTVYEVPLEFCIIGDTQAVFHRDHARRGIRMDPTTV